MACVLPQDMTCRIQRVDVASDGDADSSRPAATSTSGGFDGRLSTPLDGSARAPAAGPDGSTTPGDAAAAGEAPPLVPAPPSGSGLPLPVAPANSRLRGAPGMSAYCFTGSPEEPWRPQCCYSDQWKCACTMGGLPMERVLLLILGLDASGCAPVPAALRHGGLVSATRHGASRVLPRITACDVPAQS